MYEESEKKANAAGYWVKNKGIYEPI